MKRWLVIIQEVYGNLHKCYLEDAETLEDAGYKALSHLEMPRMYVVKQVFQFDEELGIFLLVPFGD